MRKNKQFSIRISAQDLETIRQKAVQAHMSQSDYVISCCLGKKIIILDGLKEVLRQQKAIGNNLNQLAVLANMGKVQFATRSLSHDLSYVKRQKEIPCNVTTNFHSVFLVH